MAIAKVVSAQRNFTGGEADTSLKRADEIPLLKTAGRQMRNWRVLSSGSLQNRPGRSAVGLEGPRVEEVFMQPTQEFYLAFGNTYLRVYNAAFTKVFDSGNVMPWTTSSVSAIVWCTDSVRLQIFIFFAGSQPQVLSWDGVSQTSTWTLVNYTAQLNLSGQGSGRGQSRVPFYRLSPLGVTLQPSAIFGSGITLTFSAGMNLVAGQVGTRIRFLNRQILITAVNNPTSATGTVEEPLYPGLQLACASDPSKIFSLGDEVIGSVTGATGIVAGFPGLLTDYYYIQIQSENNVGFLYNATSPAVNDTIVGPHGSVLLENGTNTLSPTTPYAVTNWDDEVMNSFRGWPAAGAFDQSRLILNNFPALPQFITWSALGNSYDLYTDAKNAQPVNAIQELAPQKCTVRYVVPGMEGNEFVFTDIATYYIPINQTTPLQPGSVAFNTLATDGSAQVQPRNVQESIVYVGAGGTQVKAIQSIGAYNRPYIIDDISVLHSHLLINPVAIASPGPPTQFEERYFYILNSDGSILIAKYAIKMGLLDTANIGFLPWSGNGTATWISSAPGKPDVLISSSYPPNAVGIVEVIDNTQLLDSAILYNSPPASLAPQTGAGGGGNLSATPVSAFLDTLGVNVHMNYAPYVNYTAVIALLQYLGISQVREDQLGFSNQEIDADGAMIAAGIQFDFLLNVTYGATNTVNLASFISGLQDTILFDTGPVTPFIIGIEGANEVNLNPVTYDGGTTPADQAQLQTDLWNDVQSASAPALSTIPVYNMSIAGTTTATFEQYGNLSAVCTYANSHCYIDDEQTPTFGVNYILPYCLLAAPGKPIVVTETGYETNTTIVYNGVDQTGQAKYLLCSLFDFYAYGVVKTFIYDLIDSSGETYGLYSDVNTPKAAAAAIHNLTTILADSGGAFSPGSLNATLTLPSNGQSTVQSLLFQKSNGHFQLVLWLESVIWNSTTQAEVPGVPATATVAFGATYERAGLRSDGGHVANQYL